MSYILEALKKAAEQRDVHAPAMRRLFAPTPETTDAPRWRIALVGGGAALGGAAVVALVWILWPAAPIIVVEKLDTPSAPAVEAPAPPAPPIVRTTPAPSASTKSALAKGGPGNAVPDKTPEPRPAPPAARAAERRRPTADDASTRPQPAGDSPSVIAALIPPPPAAAAAPTVTAPAAAATPPTNTAPPVTPRAELTPAMKLEVIVYSDERSRRLAFINGRKYAEGDTLLDGARVQEIQPNAVVIVEDGRRVLLRP